MKYESFKRETPLAAPVLSGVAGVPKFRSPYNYDREAASAGCAIACLDGTRTQQQFKEECDINTIAKNFGVTGRLPHNVRMPLFGDFSDVDDYQSALNAARRAGQSFMAMPAEVRARFSNDPQEFLAFCSDERNRDEAVKLGLVAGPPISAQDPPPPDAPKPM